MVLLETPTDRPATGSVEERRKQFNNHFKLLYATELMNDLYSEEIDPTTRQKLGDVMGQLEVYT
jgi:hypothetical protein